METKRTITDFTTDLLRLRQLLHEGRRLSDAEEVLIKSNVEALLNDIEENLKRRPKLH